MFNLFNIVKAGTFSDTLNKPGVSNLVTGIMREIINPIIGIMFLLAFVIFSYGMFQMISSSDDGDKRKNARQAILWSVIGVVIMFSVYGLVRLISYTVGAGDPFS